MNARTNVSFRVVETSTHPLWGHGWFDRTRFAVHTAEGSPRSARDVMRAFVLDPIAQRSFCDPTGWGVRTGRHGPFRHDRLAVGWYRPVTTGAFRARLAFALAPSGFTELDPSELAPVDSWVASLAARDDDILELAAPDDPDVRVDFASIWLFFHEFVAVRRDGLELEIGVVGHD